jgi:tRNA (guanine37-N1)-methyltransferase
MDFYVLTLFPEMIESGLNHSMIKRAVDNNIISINPIDIRNFAKNKHRHVDDYPYGGGAGMVMQPQPIYDAYMSIKDKVEEGTPVIYMTPQGKPYNQKKAVELSKYKDVILLCGHYEGVDERLLEEIVTDEISMGDFVLTGGELAAMAVIDSVSRLIPGVLNKEESFMDESFSNNLLEYPQYTRPEEFMGRRVPDILLSGHHKNIDIWRRQKSLERTLEKRPELLEGAELSEKDIEYLKKIR